MKKCYYIILILLFCITFTACQTMVDPVGGNGKMYSLEEAYQLKLLSYDDLEQVYFNYTNNFNEELDKNIEKLIKEDQVFHLITDRKITNATTEDVFIYGYYGTFDDCVVLKVTDNFTEYPQVMMEQTVADFTFSYSGPSIVVWSKIEDESTNTYTFNEVLGYNKEKISEIKYFLIYSPLDVSLEFEVDLDKALGLLDVKYEKKNMWSTDNLAKEYCTVHSVNGVMTFYTYNGYLCLEDNRGTFVSKVTVDLTLAIIEKEKTYTLFDVLGYDENLITDITYEAQEGYKILNEVKLDEVLDILNTDYVKFPTNQKIDLQDSICSGSLYKDDEVINFRWLSSKVVYFQTTKGNYFSKNQLELFDIVKVLDNDIVTGIATPYISDTNVDAFYELSNNEITDVSNLLPLWIIEKYDINVFTKLDKSNIYLMYNQKIISLYPWTNPGSDGLAHICVEDINDDGYIELYLSINYGKKIFSTIYAFDTKTETLMKSHINYDEINYFHYEDGILKVNDFLTIIKREAYLEFDQLEYHLQGETFEIAVTIDPNNVNFPAIFVNENARGSVSFKLDVDTKYTGETFTYSGSSTVYGAIPSMTNDTYINLPGIGYTCDVVNVVIWQNRTFTDEYEISFGLMPDLGMYDLVFNFYDDTIVIKDAIKVTEAK